MSRIWISLVLILMQSKGIITQLNVASILLPEDGKLNFMELATKYGHECEEHAVITEDGYILTVFNVKGDKSKPVLLMHGIVDSSDTFIVRGNASLANRGYDVWAGNYRGNKYSNRHLTLDPEIDKTVFWNFSQHELGVYDLPASINHILNKTGQKQLQAIGHSQGNTLFYIRTAEKPEYNDKIKLLIALGPVCYLHHTRGIVPTAIDAWPQLSTSLQLSGIFELFFRNSTLKILIEFLCTRKILGYAICESLIFSFAGYDPKSLKPEFIPILAGHYPDAVSTKNGDHLAQVAVKRRFCKFDYGLVGNYRVYGSAEPPDYQLGNVRLPVALLVGKNDDLATVEDVAQLRARLPNVVLYHEMERALFNHIDFVLGNNMGENLFPLILDLLRKYSNNRY